MNWLGDFFQVDPSPNLLVVGIYDPWLVALSVLVAMFASAMALQVVSQGANITNRTTRLLTLVGGSVALGCGVFSMHFVAMLSFDLCTTVTYDKSITFISTIPSLLASGIAFNFMSRHHTTFKELAIAGTLVGGGIGAMHYTGMAAMQMSVLLRYDPWFFALSIVVAIALATLALWIRYGLENLGSKLNQYWLILIGGAVMGIAISGMHYTGMAAARFITTPDTELTQNDTDPTFLALTVSFMTIAFSGLVFAVNALLKYRDLAINLKTMRREEEKFRFLSEFSSDAHLIFDETGIIECNPAAIEILGAKGREDLLGLHPARFSPERQPDGMLSSEKSKIMDDIARQNGSHQFEWIHRRLDGQEFPVEVTLKPIEIEGKWAIVVVWHDLTEAKALSEGLLKARDEAEAANRSKSNFLATMSHEIRTPMNSIIGFTDVLLSSDVKDKHRSHLEIVRNSAKSLLRILNDILDTAKLEQGAIEIEHITFSIYELLDQLIRVMDLEAKRKDLTLSMNLDPRIVEYYVGDPLRIRQILINILGNSIKFTDQGKVTLSVYPEGNHIHFKIEDTGIGIAQDRLEKIFEPFTQADATMSRRFGGTGLGTNISKQLTEIMGGEIWAESEIDKGSVFHVLLPLRSSTPESYAAWNPNSNSKSESVSNTNLGPQTKTIQFPKLRILIVDDVEQNLELTSLLFEGHTITTAKSGEEARRLASAQSFDLILMDVQMPGMDGLEATRLIRADENQAGKNRVPIIALSASVFQEDRNAAYQAGMESFVSKPIEMEVLNKEIVRLLNLKTPQINPSNHATPQMPGLDLLRGLGIYGSIEGYVNAVNKFIEENSMPLGESAIEFFAQKRDVVVSTLHRIKGVASNLGVLRFTQAIEDLENTLRSEEWTAEIRSGPSEILVNLWKAASTEFANTNLFLKELEESAGIAKSKQSRM